MRHADKERLEAIWQAFAHKKFDEFERTCQNWNKTFQVAGILKVETNYFQEVYYGPAAGG